RDAHALRPRGERLVDVVDVLDVLPLRVAADRGDVLALVRVVHVREARVVELEVRAARFAEPPHLLAVRGDETGPELVEGRVDGRVDRRLAAAVVDHARRRDRQLRHSGRRLLVHEGEVVAEDRLRDAELAVDVQRRGRELDVAVGAVEPDRDVPRFLRDAVELVDEVHVPRRAAELAVRREVEPDLLLLADDLANRLVLDPAQLDVVDATLRVLLARFEQPLRAQQAADVVGAERRLRAAAGGGRVLDLRHAGPRIAGTGARGRNGHVRGQTLDIARRAVMVRATAAPKRRTRRRTRARASRARVSRG